MAQEVITGESPTDCCPYPVEPSHLAVNISVEGGRSVEQDDQVALHKVNSLL